MILRKTNIKVVQTFIWPWEIKFFDSHLIGSGLGLKAALSLAIKFTVD